MSNPPRKLSAIVTQFNADGTESLRSEYETLTVGQLLEYVYVFAHERGGNVTRMTVDIAYPTEVK